MIFIFEQVVWQNLSVGWSGENLTRFLNHEPDECKERVSNQMLYGNLWTIWWFLLLNCFIFLDNDVVMTGEDACNWKEQANIFWCNMCLCLVWMYLCICVCFCIYMCACMNVCECVFMCIRMCMCRRWKVCNMYDKILSINKSVRDKWHFNFIVLSTSCRHIQDALLNYL